MPDNCDCKNFPAGLGTVTFGAGITVENVAVVRSPSSDVFPLEVRNGADGINERHLLQLLAASGNRAPRLNVRMFSANAVSPNAPTVSFQTDIDANGGILPSLALQAQGGNVGIGTATPHAGAKLHVNGTVLLGSGVAELRPDVDPNSSSAGTTLRFGSGSSTPGQGFEFRNLTNNATLLMVQQSGNVGIGTSTPQAKLDVRGHISLGTFGQVIRPDVQVQSVGSAPRTLRFENSTSQAVEGFEFYNSSAATPGTLLLIQQSGNIGIGTTTPQAKLDVRGAIAVGEYGQQLVPNTGTGFRTLRFLNTTSLDNEGFEFYNGHGGTSLLKIAQNGAVGIGTTTPLSRLHVAAGGPPGDVARFGGSVRIEGPLSTSGNIEVDTNAGYYVKTGTNPLTYRTIADKNGCYYAD